MSDRIVRCRDCGRKNRVPDVASGVPRCGQCGAPLPWMTEADDRRFAQIVESSSVPVLVDLWAPWCGPCRVISPALEKLAENIAGQLKLVKVNVDEATEIAQRFSVQSIPTLLLMRQGKEVGRQIGALPEAALRGWVQREVPRRERQ